MKWIYFNSYLHTCDCCLSVQFFYTDKRKLVKHQKSITGPSRFPSDYLVPVPMSGSQASSQFSIAGTASQTSTSNAENPTYVPTAQVEQLVRNYSTMHHQNDNSDQVMQFQLQRSQSSRYQERYHLQTPPCFVPLPQGPTDDVQRMSDVFLHSYESIKSPHDYEDLMESGSYDSPWNMNRNEAYTASITYNTTISV